MFILGLLIGAVIGWVLTLIFGFTKDNDDFNDDDLAAA